MTSSSTRSSSPGGGARRSPTVQHREIDRLADELYRLRQVVDAILAIAEELKRATIERTVEESGLERELELYVLGGPPDRSPLDPGA